MLQKQDLIYNMSFHHSPKIVTKNLIFCTDFANRRCYPGSGNLCYDISGYTMPGSRSPISGTFSGPPVFSAVACGTLLFAGGIDYITFPISTSLSGLQIPLTICGFYNQSTTSSNQTIYSYYLSTTNHRLSSLVRIDTGSLHYYTSKADGTFQVHNHLYRIGQDTWHYFAVTVSGSFSNPISTIYIDEVFEDVKVLSALSTTPDVSFTPYIGRSNAGAGDEYSGFISNVSIYNRALSKNEVLQNYNALKGRFGL